MAAVPEHRDYLGGYGDSIGYPTYDDFPRPPQFDLQADSLKSGNDPLSVVQLVIELQLEKMKTSEAIRARDAVVHKLAEAYDTLRQKTSVLERLQAVNYDRSALSSPVVGTNTDSGKRQEETTNLEATIKCLREEIKTLKEKATEPPPRYEDAPLKLEVPDHHRMRPRSQPISPEALHHPGPRPIDSPIFSHSSPLFSSTCSCQNSPNPDLVTETKVDGPELEGPFYTPKSEDTVEMVKARCSILASLPLPEEVPDDMLSPLVIPTPYTFNDFVASMSGPLRTSLGSYRVFHGLNTVWCPEREEHGYFYSPVFKCSTNPRVNTAHRWSAVDVINRMNKPTECFFNKDGTWYYAGVYKAFRLADLTTKEWSELSNEATQSIVKETIAGRKNTSPQNIYEISQLYAAGALKVACIALQCVGFSNSMYRALLEHTSVFGQSKVKAASHGGVAASGGGTVNGTTIHVSTPSSVSSPVSMSGPALLSNKENWSGSSVGSVGSASTGPAVGMGVKRVESVIGETAGHLVAAFGGLNMGVGVNGTGKVVGSGEKGEVKK